MRLFRKPACRVELPDVTIELWVSRRKFPVRADAILVPVAPDLKMVFGISKIARDYGADAIQTQANSVAPLEPGQAFIGTGARYRYRHTALAVIFDAAKRTSPELIDRAVGGALQALRQRGATSVLFPDMTENLLTQPSWITPEQRQSTAEITASTMIDAIIASAGAVPTVRIWVWDPANAGVFEAALRRLGGQAGNAKPAIVGRARSGPYLIKGWNEIMQNVRIRQTTIQVALGDAQAIQADAILQPTTTTLGLESDPTVRIPAGTSSESPQPGGTVTERAIASAGPGLIDELRGIGHLRLGGAALTSAHDLPQARHVIHLAVREPGFPASADTIRHALQSALVLADRNGLSSLVVPNLGGGENDYPIEQALPLTVDVLAAHIKGSEPPTSIRTVFLACQEPYEAEVAERSLLSYTKLLPI